MNASLELDSLYQAHAPVLFAFVLNLCRNEADTHDILQELFVKCSRNPLLLDQVTNPRAFLLKIAYRLTLDHFRRDQTREKHTQDFGSTRLDLFAPSQDPDIATFRKALTSALAEIPVDQRAVIHLKLWEGCTFEHIAEVLEISINTAASRYRYGLDKLRDLLRPIHREL
jgi:RNA polymerase sigma-70 factor (ECF subfamily)